MKKYVGPNVIVVLLDKRDVVTVSDATLASGVGFDGYDFGGTWL